MTTSIFARRSLAILSSFFLSLVLVQDVPAQGTLSDDIDAGIGRSEDPVGTGSVVCIFEGTVRAEDGTLAVGAVVISSAGGEAVSDANGHFRLETQIPRDAASVHVTAVGASADKTIASKRMTIPAVTGNLKVGSLQLAQSNSCTPSWLPTFGARPGMDELVYALTVFDDGTGNALYVGGSFARAGSVRASNVAKWDGSNWTSLGSGIGNASNDSQVNTLTTFDDGSGVALYAGGEFTFAGGASANNIAKWDGASWTPLGSGISHTTQNPSVHALSVLDEGNGERLIAAGRFTTAGGTPMGNIAKWDGTNWSSLGLGFNQIVSALALFDDGSGSALYAGGAFVSSGSTATRGVAKWDGSSWKPVNGGVQGSVLTMTLYDDGSGPALVVGGAFLGAGTLSARNVAKWNGSNWSALGTGVFGFPNSTSQVFSLAAFNDGSGETLYAGGPFVGAAAGSAHGIVRWDGSNWSRLEDGLWGGNLVGVNAPAAIALAVINEGAGDKLVVGGRFFRAGTEFASHIATWDGADWGTLENGAESGLQTAVHDLAVFDDGHGAALYACGDFVSTGAVQASHIAKWDGSSWAPLGTGIDPATFTSARAIFAFDDGNGANLYVAGRFFNAGGVPVNNIARWDGSNWSTLPGSDILFGEARALATFDDGSGNALYVGGSFLDPLGTTSFRLAKWDGAVWSIISSQANGLIGTLTLFNDGSGERLYAGGSFDTLGGVAANRIASWDGSSWAALGSGVDGGVFDLTSFDDGNGLALYAGGVFTSAGGVPASRVAKWDGSSWTALGTGLNHIVGALGSFDDGNGEQLVVGGYFSTAGGASANGIASWDGTSWAPLGSGMDARVDTLLVFDDGTGSALFAGGPFAVTLDSGDSYLAKWGCQFGLTNNLCNGDGGDQMGCTDCPCANNAAAGIIGGCTNSAATSARLFASGSTSVSLPVNDNSDLRFSLSGAPPLSVCILNSGDALAPFNPASICFGINSGSQATALDGLRCAVTNTQRHGVRIANGNGDIGDNGAIDPWGGEGSPPLGIGSEGSGFATGQTRYFQVINRDDPTLSCMRGLNSSQAVEVTFAP